MKIRLFSAAVACMLTTVVTAQVPYQRIQTAAADPNSWVTYSGNYQGQRYSPLSEINPGNVSRLKPTWVYQMRNPGIVETSPIVADGVMYITEPPSTATALDLRTGRPLWTYTPRIPSDVIIIGSPPVNRGVAILDDMVFLGTVNCHLIGIDAKTGIVRWDTVVDDNRKGYYITAAPLAVDGKLFIGVSGAETGIRGFVDAYDPKTGKRLWRTWTVPAKGEPGSESWGGDSAQHGGGSTWVTGSYDPDLNLVYWGTGNPAPDWNDDTRPGDNLYTCSLIAMDANTGKIKWHFQFTPHDVHDWDAAEIPVLIDTVVNGKPRKVVTMANRNGFYYVLDRTTGEFISATPYIKQNWTDGMDAKGRPFARRDADPKVEGTLVYPSISGGSNWYSPSYSPKTGLFYQAAREMAGVYFKGDAEYKDGTAYTGGGGDNKNGDDAYGAIRALGAADGKMKWEFRLVTPPMAGTFVTAGGLVFAGAEEGNFFALDAGTGKPLWETQLGGAVRASAMSFAIDGKQQVAIAAGSAMFVFGLP